MKVSGVVFDFGGVMTTTTMPERVRRLVGELGIDWAIVEAGFAKYRSLMDGDQMSLTEMYERIWREAGIEISAETQARITAEDRASYLYRNERTLEWMRSLKERGFKIGILTNMPSDFAHLFREHFADFIGLSSALVVSGEVRMFKPQPEIYRLLESRIGIPAAELCFIDDVERNCEGARKCGWQAVRFISNDQVAADFEKVLHPEFSSKLQV